MSKDVKSALSIMGGSLLSIIVFWLLAMFAPAVIFAVLIVATVVAAYAGIKDSIAEDKVYRSRKSGRPR